MKHLRDHFVSYYGEGAGIRSFFAPGRVNLIGEHIDYNGGYVFPAALSMGITALARRNSSNCIRMISLNFEGEVRVEAAKEIVFVNGEWGNYPKGVLKYLRDEGFDLPGCDLLFSSSLPEGAGLSSSAALEVLTAYVFLRLVGDDGWDGIRIAQACQFVENNFIHVNCGIMDQFSVSMGLQEHAILLNSHTMQYSYVPLSLKDYSLVIMDTHKKRELAGSKYNERRNECDQVLSLLRRYEQVEHLCQANLEQIERYVQDSTLKKRARHVISENKRVLGAVQCLQQGDLLSFASLLTQSHISLKYDYEVTGFELDAIVDEALKYEACIGARMTGGGFGGCAIALVHSDAIEDFQDKVREAYEANTALVPSFYTSEIRDGVRELETL